MTEQQRHILRWLNLIQSAATSLTHILAHGRPTRRAWLDVVEQLEYVAGNIRRHAVGPDPDEDDGNVWVIYDAETEAYIHRYEDGQMMGFCVNPEFAAKFKMGQAKALTFKTDKLLPQKLPKSGEF